MHYEMLIDLGWQSEKRLVHAIERLWAHESLRGPDEDLAGTRKSPALALQLLSHLNGEGRLPNGRRVEVGSWVPERGDGNELWFYVTMDSLQDVMP